MPIDTKAFAMRFPKAQINELSKRYEYESEPVETGLQAQARGYFTTAEFLKVVRWKSARPEPRYLRNTTSFIQAVTFTALNTPDERLRIEVLTLLDGVAWPIASALLHFSHPAGYPLLDFRALWSLGIETNIVHDFDLWQAYTHYCRDIAAEASVSMRTLDRALWQYSKENQMVS